jgi:hypothetical protein
MNVISSKTRCRLELATAAFCGCGKCGGGHLTVSGLLLFSFNDAGAAQAPCPQCARQPSLNICSSAEKHKMMLLKEEASKTVIQTSATLPRASVKAETYHKLQAPPQTTKRVKTSRNDIHMVGVGVASADAQSRHKLPSSNLPYSNIPSRNLPNSNLPHSNLPSTANKK